jgi:murein DD-endopeptidase MepM/ murein hydrolase activator NlpD
MSLIKLIFSIVAICITLSLQAQSCKAEIERLQNLYKTKSEAEFEKFVADEEKEFTKFKNENEVSFREFVNLEKEWIEITLNKKLLPDSKEKSNNSDIKEVNLEQTTETKQTEKVVQSLPPIKNKEEPKEEKVTVLKEEIEQETNVEFDNSSKQKPPKINLENIPSINPVSEAIISSTYGYRKHPIYKYKIFHFGIDLACPKGTEVQAAASGKVAKSAYSKSYGNYIIIDHGKYQTVYAHLSKRKVKKGDIIKKNQILALVGSTGISTGSHLHYEVIKDGKKVNPKEYL